MSRILHHLYNTYIRFHLHYFLKNAKYKNINKQNYFNLLCLVIREAGTQVFAITFATSLTGVEAKKRPGSAIISTPESAGNKSSIQGLITSTI